MLDVALALLDEAARGLMLILRRGAVRRRRRPGAADAGARRSGSAGERRRALADTALVGVAQVGDEVIVNSRPRDLALGSGGFDLVHVNLTRGLAARASPARTS